MEESNNQSNQPGQLNLLAPLLAKEDCASCKFCCSFRRQSLWETPVFDEETMKALQSVFPQAKFRSAGASGKSYSFDISQNYKTDDPEEGAACPFLDGKNGCSLPPELKPFDCKIWPLRAVRLPQTEKLAVALTPTCPAINKQPLEKIIELADSGLGEKILSYAAAHPDIIKEYSSFLSNIVYNDD